MTAFTKIAQTPLEALDAITDHICDCPDIGEPFDTLTLHFEDSTDWVDRDPSVGIFEGYTDHDLTLVGANLSGLILTRDQVIAATSKAWVVSVEDAESDRLTEAQP